MNNHKFPVFHFDDVQVEPRTLGIMKAGSKVQVEPKAFDVLLFLLENRGRLIEKSELLDAVWKDTNVTENALTREIARLRKTLGDVPKPARYIQTVHTRGYRFIAEVEVKYAHEANGSEAETPAIAEEREKGFLAALSPVAASPMAVKGKETSFRRVFSPKALGVIGIVGVVILGALLLWQVSGKTKRPGAGNAKSSLAILPFKSLGAGGGDEYIGAGMADALITRLSNSERLTISPTSTVLHYSDPKQDLLTIGRALQVDYVLEGKTQNADDRVRVTVQLIRIRDGASLWAATFDEKFTDIFQMQDAISEKVMAALTLKLSDEERERLRKRYTENTEAYQAFLKGHYFMNKGTKEGRSKGTAYFQEAIERDPKYAMAYAGLADCYRRLERYGASPAEFVPQSRAAVSKALELDDTVAYAHSMQGLIAYKYDGDFPKAEREYKRARELDPTLVHQWYGFYLLTLNRQSEAEAEFRRFAEFQPFLLGGNTSFGQYFYLTRQYDRAVEQLRKTLEMDANFAPAHELLGLVYEQQGLQNEALAEFQKAIALSGGNNGWGSLGHLYATLARTGEAQKALQELAERSKHTYVSPSERAVIYTALGQQEEALKSLEKAYAERSLSVSSLRFDPRLGKLREEPNFQTFVRRTGLSF